MKKGELTRQKIIATAAPLFNQRGFAGCSMQDVMEATGLEKGGLYRHFSTKEELAAEAFRYALSTSVKTRTDGLESAGQPLEQLRLFVRRFVEEPSKMAGGCPLMNTSIDADDGNSLLRELARGAMADWTARLAEIVAEGIRRREIRRGVDPRRIAHTVIATLEGALMISQIEGARHALRDARESLEELLAGIACEKRTPHAPKSASQRAERARTIDR